MVFETTRSYPTEAPKLASSPEGSLEAGKRLTLKNLGDAQKHLPEEVRRTGIALVTIDGTKDAMHAIAGALYGGMDGLSTQQKELLIQLTASVETQGEWGGIKPADIAEHGPFVIQLDLNQGNWDFAPQKLTRLYDGPQSTVHPLTVPNFDPNGMRGPLTLRSMGPLAAHVLPDEILQTGKLQFTVPEGSSLTAALAKALGTSYSKAGPERQNFILSLAGIVGTHLNADDIPAGISFYFDFKKGTFDVMQPNPSRDDPNYLASYDTQLDLPVLAERAEALATSEQERLALLKELKEGNTPTLHEALLARNGYGASTGPEARAEILKDPEYLNAINAILVQNGAPPITQKTYTGTDVQNEAMAQVVFEGAISKLENAIASKESWRQSQDSAIAQAEPPSEPEWPSAGTN